MKDYQKSHIKYTECNLIFFSTLFFGLIIDSIIRVVYLGLQRQY